MMSDQANIDPKIVFIVPYRNRANNLNVFRVMMTHMLEDYDPSSYEVFFAHQDDMRPFNRGGIKNVGFMAARDGNTPILIRILLLCSMMWTQFRP